MQRLRIIMVTTFWGLATNAWSSTNGLRNVFLNGIDISSAKSQELKHVDVRINENGDIFLVAPHYQVNEEDSFVPLSRYVQGLNQPVHKPAQRIEGAVPAKPGPAMPPATKMAEAPAELPATIGAAPTAAEPGLEPKPGEPVKAAAEEGATPPQLPVPAPGAGGAPEPATGTAPAAAGK